MFYNQDKKRAHPGSRIRARQFLFPVIVAVVVLLVAVCSGCSHSASTSASASLPPTPPPANLQLPPVTTPAPDLPASMPASEKAQIIADQQAAEARATQQRDFYYQLARQDSAKAAAKQKQ